MTSQLLYRLEVLDEQRETVVAHDVCTKVFVRPGVRRIGVQQGNIHGALFLPPPDVDGPRPRKAVMTIFGTSKQEWKLLRCCHGQWSS